MPSLLTSCQVNYMLKEFHLTTESLNPNAQTELQAPPQTSGISSHHGGSREAVRPTVSEEKKRIYRKHYDEAWYEAKCLEWKMSEYVWDVE